MSDFGRILEKWEQQQVRKKAASTPSESSEGRSPNTGAGEDRRDEGSVSGKVRHALYEWIERHPPTPEVKPEEENAGDDQSGRPAVDDLPPEDTLDLHGQAQTEARRRIRRFLAESASRGLSKVLIIHGKGHHSTDREPILKRVTYEELESSPLAGRMGVPPRELGGRGAVWVVVRQRSR